MNAGGRTIGDIIVAYNGTPEARAALAKAAQVAAEDDELVLIYVIPTKKLPNMPTLDEPEDVSAARKTIDEALDEVRRTHPKARGMVYKGDPAQVILERADILGAKLIVVGYKGLERIGHFILGDVADTVARKSKRPVLVVRARTARPQG